MLPATGFVRRGRHRRFEVVGLGTASSPRGVEGTNTTYSLYLLYGDDRWEWGYRLASAAYAASVPLSDPGKGRTIGLG